MFNQGFNQEFNQEKSKGYTETIKISEREGIGITDIEDIIEKYFRGELVKEELVDLFKVKEDSKNESKNDSSEKDLDKILFEVSNINFPKKDMTGDYVRNRADFSNFILNGCELNLQFTNNVDLSNAILNDCRLYCDLAVNDIFRLLNTKFNRCSIINNRWNKFEFENGMFYGCKFLTDWHGYYLDDFRTVLESEMKNMGGNLIYLESVVKNLKANPNKPFLEAIIEGGNWDNSGNWDDWDNLESYRRRYGDKATSYLILTNLGVISENINNWKELEELFRNGKVLEKVLEEKDIQNDIKATFEPDKLLETLKIEIDDKYLVNNLNFQEANMKGSSEEKE